MDKILEIIPAKCESLKAFAYITSNGLSTTNVVIKIGGLWMSLGQMVDKGIITYPQLEKIEDVFTRKLCKDSSKINILIFEDDKCISKQCSTLKEVINMQDSFFKGI